MKRVTIVLSLVLLGVVLMRFLISQPSNSSADAMTSSVVYRPLTFEELERFHGHVGPNAALGARMGDHAVTVVKIPRYFGLSVQVECPATPPGSCLIDGLQVSTGATMGKKNISHVPAETVKVIITAAKSGKTITYSLKPSTQILLKQWADEKMDVEAQGKRIWAMQAEELFVMEEKMK